MSFTKKCLAFGVLAVVVAGIGGAIVWVLEPRRGQHVYPADKPDS